ncbi:MAG TPA: hypothetical protein VG963_05280 [Polyangiaceae bacterium]|nr:hypothetical protein [Polyangiaceae bacterium]
MHTLSHQLDRAHRWLAAAAVALLPFQAFGAAPLELAGSFLAFDLLLLLAAAVAAPRIWAARRQWLSAPAAWMAAALALPGIASELLQHQPQPGRRIAEQAAPLAAALIVGLAAREEGGSVVRRAAWWGGGWALGLGLLGWAVDLCVGSSRFSEHGLHPVFSGLPRLFGTFAGSPERLGSFTVYWLALVLATGPRESRWCRQGALALGAAALLLSMSYAWVGGMLVAASRVPVRLRPWAVSAVLLAVLVASVPIVRGPESAELSGPCRELDVSHYLALRLAPRQCRRIAIGGRAVTAYQEAKRVSWLAFREHPFAGAGYAGFPEFAERSFVASYGAPGIHYTQPHGIFHGLAAKHGLLGLLGLCGWLAALWRGWRGSVWDWAVLGFLAIGLHIDVDRLRELWLVLAFLLSEQLAGPEDERRPSVVP